MKVKLTNDRIRLYVDLSRMKGERFPLNVWNLKVEGKQARGQAGSKWEYEAGNGITEMKGRIGEEIKEDFYKTKIDRLGC